MANRDRLKLLKLRPLLLPAVLLAGIETAVIQVPYVLSSPNLVCGLRWPIGTDCNCFSPAPSLSSYWLGFNQPLLQNASSDRLETWFVDLDGQ